MAMDNQVLQGEFGIVLSLVSRNNSLILQIETGQDKTSRMKGDFHVRFCGRFGVKVPLTCTATVFSIDRNTLTGNPSSSG
jgi:hypothetical protein